MSTQTASEMKALKFTVNGQFHEIYIKPKTLLVDVLRKNLSLTATKRGCESSACGACTVIMDGMAVKSCSILAMQANGKKVRTLEGLAKDGNLHPLQKAFLEYGAYQCGFCTSGMLNSLVALLEDNPKPDERSIREAIDGNICRCTGYNAIIRAVKAVAGGQYKEKVK